MIRVLVVDDHPAVRAAFVAFIEACPDLTVVGEAENGEAAVALAAELEPQVVLMDVRMPVLDGIEATRRIRSFDRPPNVVLISAYEHDELASAGRLAGAFAFLTKGISGLALVQHVRLAAA